MKKILIAEDDKIQREALLEFFKMKGYEVTAVGNGQKAYELMQNNYYDILVTDNQMPIMSGLELITKINNMRFSPEIKIFITGGVLSDEENLSLLKNDTKYVKKPFCLDDLYSLLKQLVP